MDRYNILIIAENLERARVFADDIMALRYEPILRKTQDIIETAWLSIKMATIEDNIFLYTCGMSYNRVIVDETIYQDLTEEDVDELNASRLMSQGNLYISGMA